MLLPELFKHKMKELLGYEYDEFINSFDEDVYKAIRRNSLKIDQNKFENNIDYIGENIPWCNEGYYISNENRPGKDIFYHCGLFYIQEPSASLPVELLDPKPGEKVLDLCAAPGGKTTQIGSKMKNTGILVANDINPKRLLSLKRNIQMFGITNSIITNETASTLNKKFNKYFDKILIDAPCSGEGMFKRDEKTKNRYLTYDETKFPEMQKQILNEAKELLKPGGAIVYSTCTFSVEENEKIIEWFLNENDNYTICDELGLERYDSFVSRGLLGYNNAVRIWPHLNKGEGHFAVKLINKDVNFLNENENENENSEITNGDVKLKEWINFSEEVGLYNKYFNNIYLEKDKLITYSGPNLNGIKHIYKGLELGYFKSDRFYPSQALASALKINNITKYIKLDSKNIEAMKFLKGETLYSDEVNGWYLVCIDEYPVGWAKLSNGVLKNHYLKEWRMM